LDLSPDVFELDIRSSESGLDLLLHSRNDRRQRINILAKTRERTRTEE
jgi:hypothetical protein